MGRRHTDVASHGRPRTPKTAPPATGAGGSRITCGRRGDSDALHVGGVKTFRTGLNLELYLLALRERLEPVHRDCGEVHEDVLASLLFDEAIALGVIEPLHFPSGHLRAASYRVNRSCTTWCWARLLTRRAYIGAA